MMRESDAGRRCLCPSSNRMRCINISVAGSATNTYALFKANLQLHDIKPKPGVQAVHTLTCSARKKVAAATDSVRTVARARFLCAQSHCSADSRAIAA